MYIQPLLSTTSKVYVPADSPVTSGPVPTLGVQLYVNGGSP